MNIGHRIKERRKQLGITADKLAERTGVSRSTIFRWEKGEIEKIDAKVLNKVAVALQTSSEYLFGAIDDPDMERDAIELITGKSNRDIADKHAKMANRPPDYEFAAIRATETLVRFHISTAPVIPLLILEAMPNVMVRSFTEFAGNDGLDNQLFAAMYGADNQDVITIEREINGKPSYIVAYNQRLPFYMLQMSMARELAFIVLGTTDTKNDPARMAEAMCFSRHLLCPRPLIRSLEDAGLTPTVEYFGSITGCYGRSLAGIRQTPGVHVSGGVNRLIREQFSEFVSNLSAFQGALPNQDDSPMADFGTYMDGYEE